MAQFRGTIKGQRGLASRLGGKKSGLRVVANGWSCGAEVSLSHRDDTDQDVVRVWLTAGSHNDLPTKLLFDGTCEELRARLTA